MKDTQVVNICKFHYSLHTMSKMHLILPIYSNSIVQNSPHHTLVLDLVLSLDMLMKCKHGILDKLNNNNTHAPWTQKRGICSPQCKTTRFKGQSWLIYIICYLLIQGLRWRKSHKKWWMNECIGKIQSEGFVPLLCWAVTSFQKSFSIS